MYVNWRVTGSGFGDPYGPERLHLAAMPVEPRQ